MKVNCFWFRRDLRLEDNTGLYHALTSGLPVLPVFIFDKYILDKLPPTDARVEFIYNTLLELQAQLKEVGSSMLVHYGKPEEAWEQLTQQYEINTIFTNHDYEPYAKQRDESIEQLATKKGITFKSFKDHVIFERLEVTKDDGTPYTVFTPYSKKWKKLVNTLSFKTMPLTSYNSEQYVNHFVQQPVQAFPSLESMGFQLTNVEIPNKTVAQSLIKSYDEKRNFPAIQGTSRLGIHFRFGTISIREKARKAFDLNETFLNELIWRDFYAMILANFPHVAQGAFRKEYDKIEWQNNEKDFQRWCEGSTGYPIVDAGMRELNATGFMHNRARMITASFLTKHLLIDWRWGEAYFAQKLLDFDLASNNGGWQWAAGSGTDAAPYFRIFNPQAQQEKFDKNFDYVRKWVPEFKSTSYPKPIVEHVFARERCLSTYEQALAQKATQNF